MGEERNFLVVGIGGSAGALAPLKVILGGLGSAEGIACVVALHGSPDSKVSLIDALGAATAASPTIAKDGERLRPGNVYVVPPHFMAEVEGGCLKLRPLGSGSDRHNPIDRLFRSIADDAGERSLGVLLSGEGSDGVLALTAINQAGGLTMAQSPDSAAHPSMPQAAVDMGCIDVVLPPERLAEKIIGFARALLAGEPADRRPLDESEIGEVCDLLRQRTGHDFKHYKTTTLNRRILRRMAAQHCPALSEYLVTLRESEEEARLLMRDLLVGVTSFFRDPEAYAFLGEHVIRPLLRERTAERNLRVWVPGCSTGQEAYSLAMLVLEVLEEVAPQVTVQIFATDLDDRALAVARRGLYPGTITSEVSAERIDRFFDRVGRRFKVKKALRQTVTFSRHNLISDPPFSRMDLISCRNLLIYLATHLQKKLISVFHYALREGGYLFLGASEGIGGHPDLFRVVESRFRIAQRKPTALRAPAASRPLEPVNAFVWQQPAYNAPTDLGAITQRILLDEFAPPYVVVNEEAQVLYMSAGADAFLQPPEGHYVNNVVRMARGALRVGLRAAWQRALQQRRTSTTEVLTTDRADGRRRVRLIVQPMPDLGQDAGLYMIVFQDLGAVLAGERETGPALESDRVVDRLEAELIRTRQDLERAIQDLEAANEELKSSNEELLSMNEELQSANEELLSSKEEIEAGRQALAAANADLENLLYSTEIATIFLDAEERLRRFTPAAAELYNITPADIGRPLSHFTHAFVMLPPLPSMQEVLRGGAALEHEGVLACGRTLLRRVTAYRDAQGAEVGVVVTFIDISQQKDVQRRLRESEAQASARLAELEAIYERAPVGLTLLDREMRYVRINDTLAWMNGVPVADHIGRTVREIVPGLADDVEPVFAQVMATGETVGPFELVGETPGAPGEIRSWIETWAPVKDAEDAVIGVSISAVEVTEQKRAEAAARQWKDRYEAAVLATQQLLYDWDPATDALLYGGNLEGLTGYTAAELQSGQPGSLARWIELVHPADRQAFEAEIRAVRTAPKPFVLAFRIVRKDGALRHCESRGHFLRNPDGSVERMIGLVTDVTEKRLAELAVADREARYRSIFENVGVAVWEQDFSGVVEMLDQLRSAGVRDVRRHFSEHPDRLAAAQARVRVTDVNTYALELFEAEHKQAMLGALPPAFPADNSDVFLRELETLWQGGRFMQAEASMHTLHGRPLDVVLTISFLGDRCERTLVSVLDISEKTRFERRLAESEERLRLAVMGTGMGTWDVDLRTGRAIWSATHFEALGYPPPAEDYAAARLEMWHGRVHPDDLPAVDRALTAARRGGLFAVEHRVLRPDSDEVRWLSLHGRFVADEAGEPSRFIGILFDVTARKRAEQHEKMLIRELNHRVKNLLATIQALATHTLRHAASLPEFRDTFLGRLQSVAAAHDLLTASNWTGAPLISLIERQIGPYAPIDQARVRLAGPPVTLSPQQAHLLGLVLHELTTNAVKYGALSADTGHIDITWTVADPGPTLHLEWLESGGPAVTPPQQKGFGTLLIEQSLKHSLSGDVSLLFEEAGLRALLLLLLSAQDDDDEKRADC